MGEDIEGQGSVHVQWDDDEIDTLSSDACGFEDISPGLKCPWVVGTVDMDKELNHVLINCWGFIFVVADYMSRQ